MDSLEGNRAQQYASVDAAMKFAQQFQSEAHNDQFSIFNISGTSENPIHSIPKLPDLEDWNESEKLKKEKSLMGFYLTGHPLLKYADDLENFSNYDFSEQGENGQLLQVRLGGVIQNIRYHFDKKNQQMAFFTLDCLGGKADVLMFHKTFMSYKNLIEDENLVFIKGRPTTRLDEDTPKIIAEEVLSQEEAKNQYVKKVNILVEVDRMKVDDVDSLFKLAKENRGNSPLFFHVHEKKGDGKKILTHNIRVSSAQAFINKLRGLYGDKNVWVD
jgi:DNA polymerase-3 subunit alpha